MFYVYEENKIRRIAYTYLAVANKNSAL